MEDQIPNTMVDITINTVNTNFLFKFWFLTSFCPYYKLKPQLQGVPRNMTVGECFECLLPYIILDIKDIFAVYFVITLRSILL